MNKSFAVTFSISVIILAAASVIMLMLLLPKQLISLETSVENYTGVEKANYTYTKTKDISKEALLKEYKISSNDIINFKNKKGYIPGNSDPFARKEETNDGTSTGTNTSGNKNNSNGTNNSSTSSSAQEAKDKTTNSNGGIENPPSTSK
ncbi:unknown [Clostridium sp. CAG:1219]|nr:unknown [Clostridium sp. CAG:1219]